MAKFVFIALVVIFFGGFSLHFISQNPSAIFITLGEKTVELSLWFGIFLYCLSICGTYLLFVLSRAALRPIVGSLSWFRESREKRAERRTQAGLVHFVEGNWLAAKKDLLGAVKDVDEPLVNYLAAARSAHELGNTEETKFLLAQAEKADPKNDLAINLSLAKMHLADKKYEQSIVYLKKAESHAHSHPVIYDLLRENYICLRDWPSLVDLLPKLKSSGLYSLEDYRGLEENTYLSWLGAMIDASKKTIGPEKTNLAEFWQQLPKTQKKNSKIIGLYCQYLKQVEKDDEAEGLIRKSLKNSWHSGLVDLYGKLNSSDPKTQLATAEAWLKEHGEDAYLLSSLGVLCMKNSLWGKARDYFDDSLRVNARPEIFAAMGELMTKLGEHQKSAQYYKQGLLLKTR